MKRYLLVVGALLALASCSAGMPDFNLPSFITQDTPSGFYGNLSNEYKNLAAFESEQSGDEADAAHFEAKARKALRQQNTEPDRPVSRNIPDFAIEELVDARSMLMDALAHLMVEDNEALLALAQTQYDCWLAHQEDVDDKNAYISCKSSFYDALGLLNIPREDLAIHSVHFESGAIALDAPSRDMVGKLAERYRDRDHWTFTLTGFADSTGNKHQNDILSMRRAIAVKNTLGQYGVDLNDIAISAEGEELPDENPDEAADSRRVEIRVRPHYVAQNKKGLHVMPGWRHSLSN